MATHPREGKLIYHITALRNLESILVDGLSPRSVVDSFTDVADNEIIEHREKHDLNKFVPFHFIGGSPFAGAVQSAYPSEEFVYITLSRETAKAKNFKILTKHPLALDDCQLLDYEEGILAIDWETMNKRDYRDHNCKIVCLAECLCDRRILHTDFRVMYCRTEAVKSEIIELVRKVTKTAPPFHINVANYWFKK